MALSFIAMSIVVRCMACI